MKKKYIVLIILLISSFLIIYNLDSFRSIIKKGLTTEVKWKIKELFFGKERLEELRQLNEYGKMNYKQKVLPETQFTNMYLKEVLLNDLKPISEKFFIEQFNEDLVIVDHKGKIFFINKNFIADLKDFNWIQVSSNLISRDVRIKDVLILNSEIYISYAEFDVETKKCDSINISRAKISKNGLDFEIFFTSKECKGFNGGRMVFYNHNDEDGLLLTTSAECGAITSHLAQDDNSIIGKILFIDFETKNYKIFSKGHRTPQGLTIEKNFILSAEHGPTGGDEINLIQFGKNYGWDISSYGQKAADPCVKKSSKVFDYLKNHSDHGFVEPIYAFVPSIGINQIIKVPDNFSEYWKNNFLVTSLAARTIYRMIFDKNFTKLIYHEKIYIGKRMRDIYYIKEFNVFLLALEGNAGDAYTGGDFTIPSIGILSNSLE